MGDIFAKAWDALKDILQSVAIAWLLFLVSGVWLVLPASAKSWLGFAEKVDQYRAWFGLVFLVACAALAMHAIKWVRAPIADKARLKATIARAKSLSGGERMVLAYCVLRGQQSITLPLGNATATSLTNKGFLTPASGAGVSHQWAYIVPDSVWEWLRSQSIAEMVGAPDEDFAGSDWVRRMDAAQRGDPMSMLTLFR